MKNFWTPLKSLASASWSWNNIINMQIVLSTETNQSFYLVEYDEIDCHKETSRKNCVGLDPYPHRLTHTHLQNGNWNWNQSGIKPTTCTKTKQPKGTVNVLDEAANKMGKVRNKQYQKFCLSTSKCCCCWLWSSSTGGIAFHLPAPKCMTVGGCIGESNMPSSANFWLQHFAPQAREGRVSFLLVHHTKLHDSTRRARAHNSDFVGARACQTIK